MNSKLNLSIPAVLALALLAGAAMPAFADATNYEFGVSEQRTNITFQSETDFETVLGSSRKLMGTAVADFDAGHAEINITVPVASLNTGIDLRDEHLRSPMWLDAAKHPEISFVSTSAKKTSRNRWKVRGTFTMHGVSQEITTTVDVRQIPAAAAETAGLEPGEWIRVTVPFQVKLSDFGVQVPEMAAAKVNDLWEINVQAFARNGASSAPMAMNPCNPCSGKAARKASNPTNPCG
jgi:polyisoprenoid-binding protein YceI